MSFVAKSMFLPRLGRNSARVWRKVVRSAGPILEAQVRKERQAVTLAEKRRRLGTAIGLAQLLGCMGRA